MRTCRCILSWYTPSCCWHRWSASPKLPGQAISGGRFHQSKACQSKTDSNVLSTYPKNVPINFPTKSLFLLVKQELSHYWTEKSLVFAKKAALFARRRSTAAPSQHDPGCFSDASNSSPQCLVWNSGIFADWDNDVIIVGYNDCLNGEKTRRLLWDIYNEINEGILVEWTF